jgi:acylphosphatase
MPVKIKSMETAPNGTINVKLSFPDSELDRFLQWYGSGNGKKRRSPAASRKAVRTRRKNAASK